jgi:hypothetical protein
LEVYSLLLGYGLYSETMSKMNNYFSFKALRDHPERIEQITNKIWTLFPKEQKISTYSWALKSGKVAHLRQISSFNEAVCRNGLERRRVSKARSIARRSSIVRKEIQNALLDSHSSEASEVSEANSYPSDSPKTPEVSRTVINSTNSVNSTNLSNSTNSTNLSNSTVTEVTTNLSNSTNSTNSTDIEATANSMIVNVPSPIQVDTNVTVRFVPYQSISSTSRSTKPAVQSTQSTQNTEDRQSPSCDHYTLTGLPDPPDFSSLINSTITRISSTSPVDFNSEIVDQSTVLKLMFENQQLLNENARLTELLFQKTDQVNTLLRILHERSS